MWKTTKYEHDGIKFMSQGEVTFYKAIKASGLNFEYQPAKIEILPKFTGAAGKTYQAMMYEPDFAIMVDGTWDDETSTIAWTKTIYIEVKGQNDNIYTYRKGQRPQIKDQSELYSLRHKLFDERISKNGDIFMVIRDNQLKTPEYAGQFWDKDLQAMRTYKTKGDKAKSAQVPRAIDRIKMIIDENNQLDLGLDETS